MRKYPCAVQFFLTIFPFAGFLPFQFLELESSPEMWHTSGVRRWMQESLVMTGCWYIINNISALGCGICSSDPRWDHIECFHHPRTPLTNKKQNNNIKCQLFKKQKSEFQNAESWDQLNKHQKASLNWPQTSFAVAKNDQTQKSKFKIV